MGSCRGAGKGFEPLGLAHVLRRGLVAPYFAPRRYRFLTVQLLPAVLRPPPVKWQRTQDSSRKGPDLQMVAQGFDRNSTSAFPLWMAGKAPGAAGTTFGLRSRLRLPQRGREPGKSMITPQGDLWQSLVCLKKAERFSRGCSGRRISEVTRPEVHAAGLLSRWNQRPCLPVPFSSAVAGKASSTRSGGKITMTSVPSRVWISM